MKTKSKLLAVPIIDFTGMHFRPELAAINKSRSSRSRVRQTQGLARNVKGIFGQLMS